METLYTVYAFIFGCLIGSFLNVVILRLPVGKNLVSDRSACPQCGNQLKWYHNIPVISFSFLLGKCGFCGARISWRYPLIEILTGLASFWLFPDIINVQSLGYYVFYFTLACIFICHFFIDLDHQLLLDKLNIYLLVILLPFCAFTFHWTYWAIGGALGFCVPLFVTWLFYKIRGQIGLGGGDIKLFGILGLYLGPSGIFLNIFMSCFLGAIIGLIMIATKKLNKENPMAFGPAILLTAAFQIFFPEQAQIVIGFLF